MGFFILRGISMNLLVLCCFDQYIDWHQVWMGCTLWEWRDLRPNDAKVGLEGLSCKQFSITCGLYTYTGV